MCEFHSHPITISTNFLLFNHCFILVVNNTDIYIGEEISLACLLFQTMTDVKTQIHPKHLNNEYISGMHSYCKEYIPLMIVFNQLHMLVRVL